MDHTRDAYMDLFWSKEMLLQLLKGFITLRSNIWTLLQTLLKV